MFKSLKVCIYYKLFIFIKYDKIRKEGKAAKDTVGGITPDVVFADSQKVDITYSLYIKHFYTRTPFFRKKLVSHPKTFQKGGGFLHKVDYNNKHKLMMDVMRIDDTTYKNKKGKNPFLFD